MKNNNDEMNFLMRIIVDAKEQFAAFGEVVVDLATENEAWENVPIVDYATKILKVNDVRKKNKIKRNYAAFLKSVSSMDEIEINKYKELLFSGNEMSEEVAETIFDILLNSSKPIKASVLGNLSVALARNDIDIEEYDTLALIIQSCSISALKALPEFIKNNNMNTYKSRNTGSKEEPLLLSMGVATRVGSMFRLDSRGENIAAFGFNLEIKT
jgi:DNA-directed RNA polymerase subunit F